MKHLKTYEANNNHPKQDDFKNYLIYDWTEEGDEEGLALLEFQKIDYKNERIDTHLIYSYGEDNKLKTYRNELFVVFFESLEGIIYQSDNLKDCLDAIYILKTQNKYNL